MTQLSSISPQNTTIVPPSILQSVEPVTPAIAKEWLQLMICNQRAPAEAKVLQYSRAMLSGEWTLSASILFNSKGELIDGQHRLLAVIKSECTIPFIVNRNMPDNAVFSIDMGLPRTAVHLAKLAGFEANSTHVSILNCCFLNPRSSNKVFSYSRLEQVRFLEKHWDAISFANKTFGKGRHGRYAPFLAPVARAYYNENRKRLEEFLSVYYTGFPVSSNASDDSAAIALRNLYFSETRKVATRSSSSAGRVCDYHKASGALKNFIMRKPIKVLKESTVNHFPVPDFDRWWLGLSDQ